MGVGTITELVDLTGWVPIRVERADGDVAVSWCWADGMRSDRPFWTDSINELLSDPFRMLFQHSGNLADLIRHADQHRAIEPSGFVYHLSRCGSTLVASALGSLPGVCVLSEPAPVDHMLRAVVDRPFNEQVRAIRAIVRALTPEQSEQDRHLVIKLDSWHIHQFPILRAAFPATPWIFLARDPLEVMVSHQRQHGAQMIPGAIPAELFQVPPGDPTLEEYGAHVLARMLDSAVQHHDDGAILVDYTELPDALTTRIALHFRIPVHGTMDAVLAHHAKNPALTFQPDGPTKRQEANSTMFAAAENICGPSYRRFNEIRFAEMASEARA